MYFPVFKDEVAGNQTRQAHHYRIKLKRPILSRKFKRKTKRVQTIWRCEAGAIQEKNTNHRLRATKRRVMTENSPFATHLLPTLHPIEKVTAMTMSHAQHLIQPQVTLLSGNAPDTTSAIRAHANGFLKYQPTKRMVMASSLVALLLAAVVTSCALREMKRTGGLLTAPSTAPVPFVSPASRQALASAYKQNKVKGSIFPEPATR